MDSPSLTPQQFAAQIKAKYPAYKNVGDLDLTKAIIAKYPAYKSWVTLPSETQQTVPQTAITQATPTKSSIPIPQKSPLEQIQPGGIPSNIAPEFYKQVGEFAKELPTSVYQTAKSAAEMSLEAFQPPYAAYKSYEAVKAITEQGKEKNVLGEPKTSWEKATPAIESVLPIPFSPSGAAQDIGARRYGKAAADILPSAALFWGLGKVGGGTKAQLLEKEPAVNVSGLDNTLQELKQTFTQPEAAAVPKKAAKAAPPKTLIPPTEISATPATFEQGEIALHKGKPVEVLDETSAGYLVRYPDATRAEVAATELQKIAQPTRVAAAAKPTATLEDINALDQKIQKVKGRLLRHENAAAAAKNPAILPKTEIASLQAEAKSLKDQIESGVNVKELHPELVDRANEISDLLKAHEEAVKALPKRKPLSRAQLASTNKALTELQKQKAAKIEEHIRGLTPEQAANVVQDRLEFAKQTRSAEALASQLAEGTLTADAARKKLSAEPRPTAIERQQTHELLGDRLGEQYKVLQPATILRKFEKDASGNLVRNAEGRPKRPLLEAAYAAEKEVKDALKDPNLPQETRTKYETLLARNHFTTAEGVEIPTFVRLEKGYKGKEIPAITPEGKLELKGIPAITTRLTKIITGKAGNRRATIEDLHNLAQQAGEQADAAEKLIGRIQQIHKLGAPETLPIVAAEPKAETTPTVSEPPTQQQTVSYEQVRQELAPFGITGKDTIQAAVDRRNQEIAEQTISTPAVTALTEHTPELPETHKPLMDAGFEHHEEFTKVRNGVTNHFYNTPDKTVTALTQSDGYWELQYRRTSDDLFQIRTGNGKEALQNALQEVKPKKAAPVTPAEKAVAKTVPSKAPVEAVTSIPTKTITTEVKSPRAKLIRAFETGETIPPEVRAGLKEQLGIDTSLMSTGETAQLLRAKFPEAAEELDASKIKRFARPKVKTPKSVNPEFGRAVFNELRQEGVAEDAAKNYVAKATSDDWKKVSDQPEASLRLRNIIRRQSDAPFRTLWDGVELTDDGKADLQKVDAIEKGLPDAQREDIDKIVESLNPKLSKEKALPRLVRALNAYLTGRVAKDPDALGTAIEVAKKTGEEGYVKVGKNIYDPLYMKAKAETAGHNTWHVNETRPAGKSGWLSPKGDVWISTSTKTAGTFSHASTLVRIFKASYQDSSKLFNRILDEGWLRKKDDGYYEISKLSEERLRTIGEDWHKRGAFDPNIKGLSVDYLDPKNKMQRTLLLDRPLLESADGDVNAAAQIYAMRYTRAGQSTLYSGFPVDSIGTFLARTAHYIKDTATTDVTDKVITKLSIRKMSGQATRTGKIAFELAKPIIEHFDKMDWDKEIMPNYIDRIENHQPVLDPAAAKWHDFFKEISKAYFNEFATMDLPIADHFKDNFVSRWYKDVNQARNILRDWGRGGRSMMGSKRFTHERSPLTWSALLKANPKLQPLYPNPAIMDLLQLMDMDRFMRGMKTRNYWKDIGMIQAGKGLRSPDGMHNPVQIEGAIGNIWSRGPKGEWIARGRYWAEAPVARVINNYFNSESLYNLPYVGRAAAMFRQYKNLTNQSRLSVSAFHALSTALNSAFWEMSSAIIGLRYGEFRRFPGKVANAYSILGATKNLIEMGKRAQIEYTHPETYSDISRAVNYMTNANMPFRIPAAYLNFSANDLKAAWQGRDLSIVPKGKWNALMSGVQALSYPIMQWLVPLAKDGAVMLRVQQELAYLDKKMPGASEEYVANRISKITDAADMAFGEYQWDNLFLRRWVRDIGQNAFFSVTWTGGFLALAAKGTIDIPREAIKGLSGKEWTITDATAYTLAATMMSLTVGSLINYYFTHRMPDSKTHAIYPSIGSKNEKGQEERIAFPSQTSELLKWYRHPVQTFWNKIDPSIHEFYNLLISNKDYAGDAIRDTTGTLGEQFGDMLTYWFADKMPLSARNIEQFRFREGLPWKRALLPMAGITRAPDFARLTPFQYKIYQISRTQAPQGPRLSEFSEQNRTKSALRGKMLRGEITPLQVAQLVKDGKLDGRTARLANKEAAEIASGFETTFNSVSLKAAVQAWAYTTSDERVAYHEAMMKKASQIYKYNSHPDMQMQIAKQFLSLFRHDPEEQTEAQLRLAAGKTSSILEDAKFEAKNHPELERQIEARPEYKVAQELDDWVKSLNGIYADLKEAKNREKPKPAEIHHLEEEQKNYLLNADKWLTKHSAEIFKAFSPNNAQKSFQSGPLPQGPRL